MEKFVDDAEFTNYTLALELDEVGQEKISVATENNIGEKMPIIIMDEVIMEPIVTSKITSNKIIISGGFTNKEAKDLANLIKAGLQ